MPRPMLSSLLIALIVILSLLVMTTSCSEDECTLNCNGDLRFPLALGYSWQYEYIQQKVNFRPDSDSNTFRPLDSLLNWVVTVTITNVDTVDGTFLAYEFHEVVSDADTLISEAYTWYANYGDGFYSFPDLGSGPGLSIFTLKAAGAQSPRDLRSHKILEYPLREGLQWELTNEYEDFGSILKYVIGIGEQTVPAGNYECYAVGWIWETISTVSRTSYYADAGLIRVRTEHKDLEESGNLHYGQPDGKYDVIEEFRLIKSPF